MLLDLLMYTNIFLAFIAFLSFGWGLKKFFIQPERKTLPMYFISEVGIICAIVQLVALTLFNKNDDLLTTILGALLFIGSITLYWTTIYVNRKNKLSLAYMDDRPSFLVKEGPYRLVRHPFYLSYILTWMAVPVVMFEPWLFITTLIMSLTYLGAAFKEEKKFAVSELANEYSNYKKTTGMIFPKLI